jgi:hypothetical protein
VEGSAVGDPRPTGAFRRGGPLDTPMARTVDELRNDVRAAVGRHERVESTGFTKEALEAVLRELDPDALSGGRPPTGEMRAAIRAAIGVEAADPERSFRKAELEAIAAALDA